MYISIRSTKQANYYNCYVLGSTFGHTVPNMLFSVIEFGGILEPPKGPQVEINEEIKKRGKFGLLAVTKDWQSENDREDRSRQHVQIKKQVNLKVLFWSIFKNWKPRSRLLTNALGPNSFGVIVLKMVV